MQYEKTSPVSKRDGLVADPDLQAVSIQFLNHFNHNVKAYINDSLAFSGLVTTHSVSGLSESSFAYNYADDKELPVLRLVIDGISGCFDFRIDRNYKLIYVFLIGDEVVVRFSNSYYLHS